MSLLACTKSETERERECVGPCELICYNVCERLKCVSRDDSALAGNSGERVMALSVD